MKSLFDRRGRRLLAGLSLAFFCVLAAAQTPAPQLWTQHTWEQQLKSGPRPAAYVFTTTYCSACPEAFQAVAEAARKSRQKVALIVVMMDAQGPKALRHASHFEGMTAFYTFEGHEPAIRRTIDPDWANVTPYVVLADRDGKLQRFIGQPEQAVLQRWLR